MLILSMCRLSQILIDTLSSIHSSIFAITHPAEFWQGIGAYTSWQQAKAAVDPAVTASELQVVYRDRSQFIPLGWGMWAQAACKPTGNNGQTYI